MQCCWLAWLVKVSNICRGKININKHLAIMTVHYCFVNGFFYSYCQCRDKEEESACVEFLHGMSEKCANKPGCYFI